MLTQVQEERPTSLETPAVTEHIPKRGWLWTLMVILLVAAFVGGYFTSRATEPDRIGLAPSAMVDTIDEMLATTDAQQLVAFFYEDAVLTMTNGIASEQVKGAAAIAAALTGGTAKRTSEVVHHDNLYTFAYQETRSSGIIVQRFNTDGLVVRMWLTV
jgi:hypothetical protein